MILVWFPESSGHPGSEGGLSKQARSVLAAAQELQKVGYGEIVGVCMGSQAEKTAQDAGRFGVKKVYFSSDDLFSSFSPFIYSEVLLELIRRENITTLVGPSSSEGKDLFPKVAAKLDAGQASDIIGVNTDKSLRRPMYAGDVFADVEITTEKKVITVRASAFAPAETTGGEAEVLSLEIPSSVRADAAKFGKVIRREIAASERPQLGDAGIVVSGGRALGSKENFEKLLFPLADALGAALGASRAAVDAGYAPNDWQVGQTGKIVAPSLYVAVGISGAIQHLAGMKDSKAIVAINKDPESPIFEIADVGLVGDLFEIVPQFTEGVRKAKGI